MWFRRKSKNRRLGRETVLDVRLRSSKVRAARTRVAAVSLGLVFVVIFSLYLAWCLGDWTLRRLVYENPSFALKDIDVQTDGVIASDQLRRWIKVKPGQNLIALNLMEVKRYLELEPCVQSVSIEKILPHTLRIRVAEREPVAQVNVPRPRSGGGIEMGSFQLDADGYVLVPLDARQRSTPPNQPAEQLPALAGLNPNDLQPGRRIESPQVQAALQLIQAFERSPMAGLADLQRIDVSSPDVLVVTTGQGNEVTFALSGLDQQLWRWHAVFESAQRSGRAIAAIDLAVSNNIPVRWLEAGAAPAAAPKPAKPSHFKKKHV